MKEMVIIVKNEPILTNTSFYFEIIWIKGISTSRGTILKIE